MAKLTPPAFDVRFLATKRLYNSPEEIKFEVEYQPTDNPAGTKVGLFTRVPGEDANSPINILVSTVTSGTGTTPTKIQFSITEPHLGDRPDRNYVNLNVYTAEAYEKDDTRILLRAPSDLDTNDIVLKSDGFEIGKRYERWSPGNPNSYVGTNYDYQFGVHFFACVFPSDNPAEVIGSNDWALGSQSFLWTYTPTDRTADTSGGGDQNSENDKLAVENADELGSGTTVVPSQTFIDKGSGIETNLRLLNNRAFGMRHNNRGVRWRSGLIHTFEGNTVFDNFTQMYGFRFHYNPASWTQNVNMTESIDVVNLMGSNPQNLPLLGGFAGIGLSLFVNRVIEMTIPEEELLKPELWAMGLEYDQTGVPPSDPTSDDGYAYPSRAINTDLGVVQVPGGRKPGTRNLSQKVRALKKYGTLADIEYLFKAVNGDGVKAFHRTFLMDGYEPPLSLDGSEEHSTRTADYGFLNAIPVRIWLGPDISFVGRITSLDIQHLLFTENMVPKLSQVNVTISRWLTWGEGPAGAQFNNTQDDTKWIPGTGGGGNVG